MLQNLQTIYIVHLPWQDGAGLVQDLDLFQVPVPVL